MIQVWGVSPEVGDTCAGPGIVTTWLLALAMIPGVHERF